MWTLLRNAVRFNVAQWPFGWLNVDRYFMLGGAVGGLSCCTLDINGAHVRPASVCSSALAGVLEAEICQKLLASRSRAAECCLLKLKWVWLSRLRHHAHEVKH